MIHGAVLGITVEQVKRSDTRPGFVPVAKRWVIEQTHGTLMLHRRLVRGYEILPAETMNRGKQRLLIPLPDTIAASGEHLMVPASASNYMTDDLSQFGSAVDAFRAQLGGKS